MNNKDTEAPERIYTHPTSAEFSVNPWPLDPGEYIEYVRADLARVDPPAAPTFGDGHHCTHHPDDPAHTKDCYDYDKYFAVAPPAPDEDEKALAQHRERCSGCGQEIDPTTCGCGQSINHGYDNHLIVPMGCACYRDDGENTLARQIIKKISEATLELAFVRYDLTSDEVDVDEDADVKERVAANEEFLERLKEDTLNCLTGDDFGCLDESELSAENCERLWLEQYEFKG